MRVVTFLEPWARCADRDTTTTTMCWNIGCRNLCQYRWDATNKFLGIIYLRMLATADPIEMNRACIDLQNKLEHVGDDSFFVSFSHRCGLPTKKYEVIGNESNNLYFALLVCVC